MSFFQIYYYLSMLFLIFLAIIAQSSIYQSSKSSLQQLAQIDNQIDKILSSKHNNFVPFFVLNKIYQKVIFISQESSLEYTVVPTMNYIGKSTYFYPLLLTNGQRYYNVDGILINNLNKGSHFYQHIKNDQSLFAVYNKYKQEFQLYTIYQNNNENSLKKEVTLSVNQRGKRYVSFISINYLNKKNYIFALENGQIDFYTKTGVLQQTIKLATSQLHLQKIGHQIIAYNSSEIFSISFNSNKTAFQKCSPPFTNDIQEIKSDDYDLRKFYVRMPSQIYIYQISPNCKPIAVYNIPQKSNFYPTNEIIFVFANKMHYYINLTDNKVQNVDFPLKKCNGKQKLIITKKNNNIFILSHLCQKATQIYTQYFSIEISSPFQNMIDFSYFRIPLIIISIGLIIYMSMKKQRNEIKEKKQNDYQQYINVSRQFSKKQQDIPKRMNNFESKKL